jgi:P4 family phage/plasmid primase-like protien
LIGFKNGIYDLKINKFRKGKPDDCISKCMPIKYIAYEENDKRLNEVYDFLEKVFPDKSVREYFMDISSDIFEGGNKQKTLIFWTGEGDNGKSVTQTVFEKMFGKYAIKFNTTLVTGKKLQTGAAGPEMARAGDGVRWAILEEPDVDEELNIGMLKSLTGNDTQWSRDLFQKGKDTKEFLPLFKVTFICNKTPSIKGADTAFWNRAKVIPFETTFVRPGQPYPETYEQQLFEKRFPMDTNFDKKIPHLLEPFAWLLLEHRKKIQVKGRSVEPDKVKQATNMYKKQNDIYDQFKQECIVESDRYITISQLYEGFITWYRSNFSKQCKLSRIDIQTYFTKLWKEPLPGNKWFGYRIKTYDEEIEEEIEKGTAFVLEENDLVEYDKKTPEKKYKRIL